MQTDDRRGRALEAAGARWARRVTGLGAACAGGVGALALLAFAGGHRHGPPAWSPYTPAMRPNTALCLVFLAGSLLLLRLLPAHRRALHGAFACAAVASLVALLTLGEYLLATSFGIDELMFDAPRARMSPIAAGALASVGVVFGLSALGLRAPALYQGLLTCTGLLSLLPIMGYLYRAPFLYSPGALTAVAPGTGFGLLCLTIAGFALREDEGLWPLLAGDTAGSTLLRRALPLVVGLPVGFGWLRLEAERLGNIGHELGVALIAITTVLTFAALLVWWARWLRHQDLARRLASRKLQEARDTLERRVQERTRELSESEGQLRATARDLLAAKELAERTMQARTDFLARVSHEIRTPLNGVVGMLEIALRSELTPAQRGYVQTARSSATALLALISDVLDFAKVDAGALVLESTHFRLRDCVALALRDSASAAHQKGLELYLRVDDGVPEGVVGDGQRLRQVLTNLVSNAVKFTEQGEVELSVQGSTLEGQRVALRFDVVDTGVGIARDKQREIFEAFTQADGSTTRRFGGTGLSLTISSQLVGLMGGALKVASEVGKGSRFWFTLEFEIDRDGESALRATSAAVRGKRALVAEPNPRHLAAVCALLRSWGVDAVAAGPAQIRTLLREADAARASYSWLIMAEEAAASLGTSLAELRQAARGSLGIVLMTLATELTEARQARLANGSAQLTKPLVASELLETLTHCLAEPGVQPAPRARQEAPLEVLVVEDNEVNRRVACFLLQSAGHHVVAVEDGRRALAVLAEQTFDVVLMDGHMPHMDGVETTREIRARERETARRTPIIALTAQAMKGDRERYLAAGMDAYISKPFQSAQLLRTIREVVAQQQQPAGVSVAPGALRPSQPLSPAAPAIAHGESAQANAYQREQLLTRMRDAEHLLPQVVRVFAEDAPLLLDALARAVLARDLIRVQQAAHKLVGALLTVGGNRAGELARSIENDARSGSLAEIDARMSSLRQEVQTLLEAMERAGDLVRAPAAAG